MAKKTNTENLNENERKAMTAICDDCDDLDGWGFDRPSDMMLALLDAFDGNPHRAGGYLKDLIDKGLVEIEPYEDEVWINPDVFEEFAYC